MSEKSKSDGILEQEVDEERLVQVAKLAELGLSTAAVIHEARQPLSALRLALQLMRDKSGQGEEIDGLVESAMRQTGRLEELIEHTRDFLWSGEGSERIDLEPLIASVVSLMKWQLERHAIEMEVIIPRGRWRVWANRADVEQVVFNLMHNSKDAIRADGGGKILVELRADGENDVDLIVGDDGPGMPPEVRQHAFDPFFTTKPMGRGTGLGLYIARRLTERGGGQLKALDEIERREMGRGELSTAFRVRWPAAGEGD
ncbi:MAG: HAMP domain-containing sensor histidine kinase [Polyangia bacterium]